MIHLMRDRPSRTNSIPPVPPPGDGAAAPTAGLRSSIGSRRLAACWLIALAIPAVAPADEPAPERGPGSGPERPNVILIMFDDLGYADLGFQGSEHADSPHIDEMAANSLVFERFYAQAPVCSPTRGSALTGRHPFRYGVFFANTGHLPEDELNLAVLLRDRGYRTGMFGKWHLGTLTTEVEDANRGRPGDDRHFAPPWQRGFEVCFATESKVPTFDPMIRPRDFEHLPGNLQHWWDPVTDPDQRAAYGTRYWNEAGEEVTESLEGPNARVIMDRAIPFIEQAVEEGKPFFAVIWFHEPHWPVVAGPDDTAPFDHLSRFEQHYYGCIRAADEQVGRLRATLRRLGVADDTMLWLTSDNGPEGRASMPGSAGFLRGRKRDLYDGGVRVPGLLEWPRRVTEARVTAMPAVTSDYLPTVADLLGLELPADRPLDGVSLMPLIDGASEERPAPIPFQSNGRIALVDNRFKLIHYGPGRHFAEPPYEWQLYDMPADPGERNDLAAEHPEVVEQMAAHLEQWNESVRGCLDRVE